MHLSFFSHTSGQINDFILNLDGCLAFIDSEHKRLKLKNLNRFQREEMEKFGKKFARSWQLSERKL